MDSTAPKLLTDFGVRWLGVVLCTADAVAHVAHSLCARLQPAS